jgi:hypothetical protein
LKTALNPDNKIMKDVAHFIKAKAGKEKSAADKAAIG